MILVYGNLWNGNCQKCDEIGLQLKKWYKSLSGSQICDPDEYTTQFLVTKILQGDVMKCVKICTKMDQKFQSGEAWV